MKTLFVTHPYPNFVPDLLLHGLREVLGSDVVEYPRKDCLYNGVLGLGVCPEDQRCPGWFPDDQGQIDRSDIWNKVRSDYFDLVVCDLRSLDDMTERIEKWPKRCVVIDGEDYPHHFSPGPFVICRRETDGSDFSIPLPMALPRSIFNWIARYDNAPKQYSVGFLGSTHNDSRRRFVDLLASRFPDALLQATDLPRQDNPSPVGRLSRDRYYQQLQQCHVVISLPGAGLDTFRFWEHAACQAVHLVSQGNLYIPDDFIHGKEILRFADSDDLVIQIEQMMEDHDSCRRQISQGRRKLLEYHLTTHRATYFLDRVNRAFG